MEISQSFMVGYVRRINEATFRVVIGGVRIGRAKYSRLAQINLRSRIITFSRFAIENVPERARRYLVIHELAHVVEAGHNARFWELVARYEPAYREVDRQLTAIFKENIRQIDAASGIQEAARQILAPGCLDPSEALPSIYESADESGSWFDTSTGIVYGGI
jgi:hypothetical protein